MELLRVADQTTVSARIEKISGKHISQFIDFWLPELEKSQEEDGHWNWFSKFLSKKDRPSYEIYALECEQETQGLMMIEFDLHRSRLKPGNNKNLVYVEYLATAPWNRRSLSQQVKYKGSGTGLITFAISRSISLQYKGRVGLRALPRAERFYSKLGMIHVTDSQDQNRLKYFELTEEKAQEIIDRTA